MCMSLHSRAVLLFEGLPEHMAYVSTAPALEVGGGGQTIGGDRITQGSGEEEPMGGGAGGREFCSVRNIQNQSWARWEGRSLQCIYQSKSSWTTWKSNREDRSATPRFIHRERENFKSDHYDIYIVAQKNGIVYSEGKKNRTCHDQPCKIWPR